MREHGHNEEIKMVINIEWLEPFKISNGVVSSVNAKKLTNNNPLVDDPSFLRNISFKAFRITINR